MITRVEISNYRSIGEKTELRLGNLTALVGPNGSGKSNIVDALRFVAESLRNGLEAAVAKRHGFHSILRHGAVPRAVSIEIDIEHEDGWRGDYRIELRAVGRDDFRVERERARWFAEKSGTKPDERLDVVRGALKEQWDGLKHPGNLRSLRLPSYVSGEPSGLGNLEETLKQCSFYSIFPDALRSPQEPNFSRPMDEHGTNWCSVLKDMEDGEWAPDFSAAIGHLTGDIAGFRVRRIGNHLAAEFRHLGGNGSDQSKWFAAAQESDGTLRTAGIITALLQQPSLTLIGIEEPELTIHPGMIALLFDYLKEASHRSQIIITTHSPELLSLLDADDIRVVERRDGVTTVSPIDESQRELVRERLLTLGELMMIEGLRQATPQQATGAGS